LLGVSVRMVKALTVKMETVPMNGKGAQNLTCFVYEVYEGNSKMFFSRHLIWEVLRFQSIHFPLSDVLYLWDCLKSSCIQVNTAVHLTVTQAEDNSSCLLISDNRHCSFYMQNV